MARRDRNRGSVRSQIPPPVINAPSSLSLIQQSYPVEGCSVTDDFAANNGGTMALNLSCRRGALHLDAPNSMTGKQLRVDAPFNGINDALASLLYQPGDPANDDTITINVWNQAGQQSTVQVAVTL